MPSAVERLRSLMPRRPVLRTLLALAAVIGTSAGAAKFPASGDARAAGQPPLRVCSDPDNMPFSTARGEGFENKLATLVGKELGRPVIYAWAAQDDGFVRNTLKAGRCDVIMGVPHGLRSVETTAPYYWSSYVLISRADRHLDITSLKDHRIRKLKVAVASINGNRLFSPPAQVLAGLNLVDNIVAFPVDDSTTNGSDPRARIIDAVARGEIDMAALWGPTAGYFVQHAPVPLSMVMIGDTDEFSARKTHLHLLGLQFEIAMAVRKGDHALHRALDAVIVRKGPEIKALLESFGVPLIEPAKLAAIAPADAD